MNEIQAQVVAADIDGDGALELIAADAVGSVAAWRADGTPLWEVQTSGLCAQGVTLTQSLRGDGSLQVIVPTIAGAIHLLDGRTGLEVSPFPLRTGGRILSPVLVLQLQVRRSLADEASDRPGDAHLVFSSFDGHVHVVHARTGCSQRLDIGEHSYTQVLADDMTGDGKMDLLVSTMNGNLYCFETSTPYSPLRSWRSQAQGRNVWQPREGFQGVAIESCCGRHTPRAVSGANFELEFTLHDQRDAPQRRWHRVEARLGRAWLLLNRTYHPPTSTRTLRVHEQLRCPTERARGVLTVSFVNEHGQYFEDAVVVSFNENFELVLKWAALLPFGLAIVATTVGYVAAGPALPR